MCVSFLIFFQCVINIVFHVFMHHIMEDGGHCPLISNANIFKPKRHDIPAKGTPCTCKSYLFLVLRRNFNLIISRKVVHKGVHLITHSHVHYHVNVREWKIILWKALFKSHILLSFPLSNQC